MAKRKADKLDELGPFWVHMVEITRGELIHLETGQPYPALQIAIGGESMASGDFAITLGLSAELALSFFEQLQTHLMAKPIVQ